MVTSREIKNSILIKNRGEGILKDDRVSELNSLSFMAQSQTFNI